MTTGADPTPAAGDTPDEDDDRTTSVGRVEALTDGVFAIILTILVLEIAIPPNLSEHSLVEVGKELRATLVAWIISFLITAMYWVWHRDLFARIRVVNRDLVWLNLLFLLPACLIPFASSVLGKYPDEAKAVYIYGIVVIAVTVLRTVMYWYVIRRPRLLKERNRPARRRSQQGLAIAAAPIVVYALAMALAATSTAASISLFFSVPILYFLLITLLRERGGSRAEAGEFS